MIAGVVIGAAVMFFVLIGLYVIRHVRVLQRAQRAHYERMLKFERAMGVVTSQQTQLRRDWREVRDDLRTLRVEMRVLTHTGDREPGTMMAQAWGGVDEEAEAKQEPISAWAELMGAEEP